jgi:hypothetical protein
MLLSCKTGGEENKSKPDATDKIIEQGTGQKYLAVLDATQFPYHHLRGVRAQYDWFNLKQIIPLPVNNGGDIDIRYLATMKSPFPENFTLYVIGFNEGGDCGPSYRLIAAKNERELSAVILGQVCEWENENHSTTSTFVNDSTFNITTTTAGRAEDANGYIPDKTVNKILTETYKIRSNGSFVLSDTSTTVSLR